MTHSAAVLSALLLLAACAGGPEDDTPWQELFNGEDLSGWTQLGGEAEYAVRDGAIVGTTVHDTPNSFMATEQKPRLILNSTNRPITPSPACKPSSHHTTAAMPSTANTAIEMMLQ